MKKPRYFFNSTSSEGLERRRIRRQHKKGECEMNYLVEKTGTPVQNNCDIPIQIESDGSITIVADQIILESDK